MTHLGPVIRYVENTSWTGTSVSFMPFMERMTDHATHLPEMIRHALDNSLTAARHNATCVKVWGSLTLEDLGRAFQFAHPNTSPGHGVPIGSESASSSERIVHTAQPAIVPSPEPAIVPLPEPTIVPSEVAVIVQNDACASVPDLPIDDDDEMLRLALLESQKTVSEDDRRRRAKQADIYKSFGTKQAQPTETVSDDPPAPQIVPQPVISTEVTLSDDPPASTAQSPSGRECCICMYAIENFEQFRILPCMHVFCNKCMEGIFDHTQEVQDKKRMVACPKYCGKTGYLTAASTGQPYWN